MMHQKVQRHTKLHEAQDFWCSLKCLAINVRGPIRGSIVRGYIQAKSLIKTHDSESQGQEGLIKQLPGGTQST